MLTCLEAIDSFVFALGLVTLGDNGGDVATGLADTGHGGSRVVERSKGRGRSGRGEHGGAQRSEEEPISHKCLHDGRMEVTNNWCEYKER